MTREEFLNALTELLQSDCPLTGVEELSNLANWDSMAVIGVMAMADDRCGVTFAPNRINSCVTVNDLCALVTGAARRELALH